MTQVIENIGGEYRNRTGVHGFAIQPLSQENQAGAVSKHDPTNRELFEKVSNADLTGAKENAAAAETRNGAIVQESRCEDASTALAARHPIIATHWGIAA